jgi:hypothetical protein
VVCAKLYDRKTPITAADLLNNRVVPFSDSQEVKLLRVLTDRGNEYCGNPERHEYELYFAIETRPWWTNSTASPSAKGVPFNRRAAGRPGSVDPRVQWTKDASGTLVLPQNADADLPKRDADGEGKDDRSVTISDSKPNRSTRHRLSDRVSANNNTH